MGLFCVRLTSSRPCGRERAKASFSQLFTNQLLPLSLLLVVSLADTCCFLRPLELCVFSRAVQCRPSAKNSLSRLIKAGQQVAKLPTGGVRALGAAEIRTNGRLLTGGVRGPGRPFVAVD